MSTAGAGTAPGSRPGGLVHGMGKELAEPDWSPLTDDEVTAVLARYDPADPRGRAPAAITWRSPRPMSAAALVRRPDGDVFVKRHDPRVRTARQLAAEHAFLSFLRERGEPVPAVRRTPAGASVVRRGGFAYEVHDLAPGLDLYRDVMSWSPFWSLRHARAAGAALARLHRAAAGFTRPARPQAVLVSSCDVITSRDPVRAIGRMIGARPGLGRGLRGRSWPDDVTRHLVPRIRQAAPLLTRLTRQWGHGDWHPSNLTWTSDSAGADVAGIFDFGLANQTFAVHDLATALERSTVAWLDLAESGRAAADLDAVSALLDGYESVRPLSPAETAALSAVLPVVHVEYALSEIEYFADVVASPANADLAYDGYLLDHARWFGSTNGAALIGHLQARIAAA
jgi:Ser/Thr protein kinase RdoA (MazF antagonist)